jgi:hypothetical protein
MNATPVLDTPKAEGYHPSTQPSSDDGGGEMVQATRIVQAYEHTCQRCGRVWRSFKPEPETCRRCKSYDWQTPRKHVA